MIGSLVLLGALSPAVFAQEHVHFRPRDLNATQPFASSTGAVSHSTPISAAGSDSIALATNSSSGLTAIISSASATTVVLPTSSDLLTAANSTASTTSTGSEGSTLQSDSSTSVFASTGFTNSVNGTTTVGSVYTSTSGLLSPSSAASSTSDQPTTSSIVADTSISISFSANGTLAIGSTASEASATALASLTNSDIVSSTSGSASAGASVTAESTTAQSTSATQLSTTTITSASTEAISTISRSTITTNTHVTATGSDGSQTVIPILFGCSFCRGGGIELFGFGSGPGVFEWPPSGDFSGLPAVTLDSDDNPSVEETASRSASASATQSSSASSSSRPCISSLVTTQEYVTCHAARTSGGSAGSASASCSTVTSTITGCDLTASATTTTATSTATCWQYNGWTIDADDDGDDSTDTSSKRSVAGRMKYEADSEVRSLVRRAANEYSEFGKCSIDKVVESPSYPKKSFFNKNKKSSIMDQYWWEVESATCPGIAHLQRTSGKLSGQRYDRVNVDHVYEKALPSQFLSNLFANADETTCNIFKSLFADTTDGNFPSTYKIQGAVPDRPGQSRLQSLFNYLGNNDNLQLIVMDKTLNEKKGKLLNVKLDGVQLAKADSSYTQENLQLWNQVGMLFELLNTDVTQRVFSSVQNQMYSAWVRFDEIWEQEACGQDSPNFADGYKSYMSTLLSTNAASAQAWATSVSSIAVQYATTTDEQGNLNAYGSAIATLSQSYDPATLTWSTDPYLQFPQSTASIKKRAAACTLSASATTTQSHTAESTTSGSETAFMNPSSEFTSSASNSTSALSSLGSTSSTANSLTVTSSLDSSSSTSASTVVSSISESFAPTSTAAPSTTSPIASLTTTSAVESSTPSCDATTVYFAKDFEFYGIGWDGTILGNGAGFETALIDCSGSSIEDWVFNYQEGAIEDEDGGLWDFKATGEMKGASDCYVEAALKSGGCRVGGGTSP